MSIDGMADAARGMTTDVLVREKMDLNDKANRGEVLTDSELAKGHILDREIAQRPVWDRVMAGAREHARRSLGAQSVRSLRSLDVIQTYPCFCCNGSGIVDSNWNSGTCPICNGNGKIQVSQQSPISVEPIPENKLPLEDNLLKDDKVKALSKEDSKSKTSKSGKFSGSSPKTAKASSRPSTVEGSVKGGDACYYKFAAKSGDQISFTIYAQHQVNGAVVECSFALQDEEGGIIDSTTMCVTATGEDFNRDTLTTEVDDDGTYLFRFRSNDDVLVKFKIKLK